MDERLRKYNRAWKQYGDIQSHAQVIREALRCSRIKENSIAFCAFLGHEASALALNDVRRTHAFIWKEKHILNGDVREKILGLSNWGRTGVELVTLCMLTFLQGRTTSPDILKSIDAIKKSLIDRENPHGDSETRELYETLRSVVQPRMRDRQYEQSLYRNDWYITSILVKVLEALRSRMRTLELMTQSILIATTNFPELEVMDSISKQVYQNLLKEYA